MCSLLMTKYDSELIALVCFTQSTQHLWRNYTEYWRHDLSWLLDIRRENFVNETCRLLTSLGKCMCGRKAKSVYVERRNNFKLQFTVVFLWFYSFVNKLIKKTIYRVKYICNLIFNKVLIVFTNWLFVPRDVSRV